MQFAVSESRQRYEARFKELRHQLTNQHIQEKDALTQQVVLLEARLVECLKENDVGAGGSGGRGVGVADVEGVLRTATESMKKDVMALVSLMQ